MIISSLETLATDWKDVLRDLIEAHGQVIDDCIKASVLEVYPSTDKIFEAFKHFDVDNTRVVIIGQDPYQSPGLANGLAFSVPNTAPLPPSLRNIFKELDAEYGHMRTDTDLTDWAKQGVLLLNRALTVQQFQSNSHANVWLKFTEEIVKTINERKKNVVYMLWGNFAQNIEHMIDAESNLILKHTHPSPLSRKPFVGNGHFKLANVYLEEHGMNPVNWV